MVYDCITPGPASPAVLRHIEEAELLVEVWWVGGALERVLATLALAPASRYLVLHHAPR